jgi:Xaa-Pro aminopeptidase
MAVLAVHQAPYPYFPADEYVARTHRAQELMRKEGLDLLLLSGRENVEYLGGFICGHWNVKGFPPAVVLVPQQGAPVLVLPAFLAGTARGSSWIADVRTHANTHSKPRDFPRLVVETIASLGTTSGRIGLEAGDELMPHLAIPDYEYIKAHLPKAELTSAAGVLWGLRMIKSAREIVLMEELMGMTNRALRALMPQIRSGMTELEVSHRLKAAVLAEGAEGHNFLNIRAGKGRYAMADSVPLDNPLRPGDMLILDTGVVHRSYKTDVAYVGHVGAPSQEHRDVYKTAVEALDAALAAIKPGVSVAEVWRASDKVLRRLGFGRTLDMVGHGVGMDTHEPPVLSDEGHEVLEEGMVLAVEPWFYDTDGLGVFAIEEMVVVTRNGHRNLSDVPRDDLWVIL